MYRQNEGHRRLLKRTSSREYNTSLKKNARKKKVGVKRYFITANLVASIGTSMKKEAMDSCFVLTVLTISGDIWTFKNQRFSS